MALTWLSSSSARSDEVGLAPGIDRHLETLGLDAATD
jgi:hypothetical protein